MKVETTACFTGHRPEKLYGYDPFSNGNGRILINLREIIIDHIENKGVDTFITGMALGIDMWAARLVLKLRETYPHIKLVAAIPCAKQWSKWREESRREWDDITNKADDIYYVSEESYTAWCMQKRNEWMVNNSAYVIAVWDGTKGGTANCVRYAEKVGRVIVQLNPQTYEITN